MIAETLSTGVTVTTKDELWMDLIEAASVALGPADDDDAGAFAIAAETVEVAIAGLRARGVSAEVDARLQQLEWVVTDAAVP